MARAPAGSFAAEMVAVDGESFSVASVGTMARTTRLFQTGAILSCSLFADSRRLPDSDRDYHDMVVQPLASLDPIDCGFPCLDEYLSVRAAVLCSCFRPAVRVCD